MIMIDIDIAISIAIDIIIMLSSNTVDRDPLNTTRARKMLVQVAFASGAGKQRQH
jgi:hypothetical protein